MTREEGFAHFNAMVLQRKPRADYATDATYGSDPQLPPSTEKDEPAFRDEETQPMLCRTCLRPWRECDCARAA